MLGCFALSNHMYFKEIKRKKSFLFPCLTISSALHSSLKNQVSLWYYFPSARRTVSGNSCNAVRWWQLSFTWKRGLYVAFVLSWQLHWSCNGHSIMGAPTWLRFLKAAQPAIRAASCVQLHPLSMRDAVLPCWTVTLSFFSRSSMFTVCPCGAALSFPCGAYILMEGGAR